MFAVWLINLALFSDVSLLCFRANWWAAGEYDWADKEVDDWPSSELLWTRIWLLLPDHGHLSYYQVSFILCFLLYYVTLKTKYHVFPCSALVCSHHSGLAVACPTRCMRIECNCGQLFPYHDSNCDIQYILGHGLHSVTTVLSWGWRCCKASRSG